MKINKYKLNEIKSIISVPLKIGTKLNLIK